MTAVPVVSTQALHIRAEMARRGLTFAQLVPWWSPDTDSVVVPLDDPEVQREVRMFMAWLWKELS